MTKDQELEIYHLELSMQNEELRRVGLENELNKDKYQKLYDFAPVGFFTCDNSGLILEVNRTGALLFDVEKDQLLGKVLTGFVAAADQPIFFAYCELLRRTKSKQECELNLRKKDGTFFLALIEGITEKEQDEITPLFFLAVKDISEQKKNEENRLNYERLESLGILAGGIAHDFNNLLTVILGSVTLVQKSCPQQGTSPELLAAAEKACRQAKDLTLQLLTFAKGGQPVKEVASIAQLLEDTVIFAMRGSNVLQEVNLPADLWLVEVDGGQIRQVVNNLIINAQQAMPEGGTMSLRCENISLTEEARLPLNPGPYLRITVADHGIGIPKELLNRIFDPYFTTKTSGSGLGLATSYSIVKRHGGHIQIESEPGRGTTVAVYLPALPDGRVLAAKKSLELASPGQGKILVMDDNPSIRKLLGEMLALSGWEASLAADGKEAIGLYREALDRDEPFAAVIFDLTIPGGIGGRKALEEIKKIDHRVKAVVSSGYCNDTVLGDYLKYGFQAVLPKPFSQEELSRIIRDTVSA